MRTALFSANPDAAGDVAITLRNRRVLGAGIGSTAMRCNSHADTASRWESWTAVAATIRRLGDRSFA